MTRSKIVETQPASKATFKDCKFLALFLQRLDKVLPNTGNQNDDRALAIEKSKDNQRSALNLSQ